MFQPIPIYTLLACATVSTVLFVSACTSETAGNAMPQAAQTAQPAQTAQTVRTVPLVVAHRGGTGDAPENTLVAIREALANHADAIWLTVQLSRDGVPVLYHDTDLDTLTDAHGPVASKRAAELARVNAGLEVQDKRRRGP